MLNGKDKVINELKEKLEVPPCQVLQTPELAEVELEKEHLQQRVIFLHSRINNLTHENKALSQKMDQAPVLNNPLSGISGENNELSTEEIVTTMAQVQLKEIQIYELHLEIDRLKKVDQMTQKIGQLEEKIE